MGNNIRGLTIEISASTKKFMTEMNSLDRSILSTQKQVKALAESLKFNWDQKKFVQAQKLAQDAVSKTEEKAIALRSKLAELESQKVDPDWSSITKLRTELVKAEDNVIRMKAKLQEIKELKIDHIASQFEKVGSSASKLSSALAPISAAAAAILAAFSAISISTIKTADDIATMSTRLNMTAEEWQKWDYIAMQTDLASADMQQSFAKVQGALSDLASGQGSAALEKLGINVEQAAKGMGPNLGLIIERLAAIEDPIQQAALAYDLLGDRMASKFIPLLKAGGAGLAELSLEFETFEYLTDGQVAALGEFDNVMNRIKYSFETIRNQLGAALLPLMERLAAFVNDSIIPAVQKLADGFASLSVDQQELIAKTLLVVGALAPVLGIVGKLSTGLGGMIRSLGTLTMSHPAIAAVAAIAAVLTTLYLTNEDFRNSINGLLESLGKAFMPILEALGNALVTIVKAMEPLLNLFMKIAIPLIKVFALWMEFLGNKIAEYLVPKIEIFGKVIAWIFESIPKWILSATSAIDSFINGIIDKVNFVIKMINAIGEILGFQLEEIGEINLTAKVDAYLNGQANQTSTPTDLPVSPSTAANTQIASSGIQPYVVNNNSSVDNSSKTIQITNVLNNYANPVDYDEFVRMMQLKLAGQF